jgi:hypothetical protein
MCDYSKPLLSLLGGRFLLPQSGLALFMMIDECYSFIKASSARPGLNAMQEDILVKNLISTLETAAKTMDARRVTRVRVKLALGPQELQTRQVEEIFLRLSQGTIAEGARLEIDEIFDAEAEELLIEEADLIGPVTNNLGREVSQPPG